MNTQSIARQWNDLGIATIPIRHKSKKPALHWQRYIETLPTRSDIESWWRTDGYGLAVVTGWQNLAVIDFDSLWGYSKWLNGLSMALAHVVFMTYRVNTRQGVHVYLYCDELPATRSFKLDGLPFDTRAVGGYAISEPSIHPTGFHYSGIGRPTDIQHVESIFDFIPEAKGVKRWTKAPSFEVGAAKTRHSLWDRVSHDRTVDIDAIKESIGVSSLVVIARRTKRYLLAHCPYHDDQHASMAIYPDRRFNCFACNVTGDLIDLWAFVNKMTLAEALVELSIKTV